MDVCAVLPGEVVAAALSMPLARTEGGVEGRICSYYLTREARPEARVDVVIETGGNFLVTRSSSDGAEEVPELGVAALFKLSFPTAAGITRPERSHGNPTPITRRPLPSSASK